MFGLTTGVMAYNRTARKRQQIIWNYDGGDPLAVTFHIPCIKGTNEWVEWQVSREELGNAYVRPPEVAPRGTDVYIELYAKRERLIITLYPGATGQTVISLPSGEIWEFLRHTHKSVPPCTDGGRCVGIVREDCLECTLVGSVLEAALPELLDDEPPFTAA